MRASVEPPAHGRQDVVLESALGEIEYEISFSLKSPGGEDAASRFAEVVTQQARIAATTEVKKKLGHEHLLKKRASIRYAESIAMKKVKEQPEAPVTASELIANVPLGIM